MIKIIYILSILSFYKLTSQVPSAEILRQTYKIQTDTLSGSSFLIEYNSREYLITAKHLFKKNLLNKSIVNINLLSEKENEKFKAKISISRDSSIDIAVLELPVSIKKLKPFNINPTVTIGQQILFLGYPSFNGNNINTFSKAFGIFPLVKKGIVSALLDLNKYTLYFLDGHNNPGFSGGPVIGFDPIKNETYILGVVSGYIFEKKPLINDTLNKFSNENSGIIICYPIHLIESILN
jgi:S1-C subfamily serine protease